MLSPTVAPTAAEHKLSLIPNSLKVSAPCSPPFTSWQRLFLQLQLQQPSNAAARPWRQTAALLPRLHPPQFGQQSCHPSGSLVLLLRPLQQPKHSPSGTSWQTSQPDWPPPPTPELSALPCEMLAALRHMHRVRAAMLCGPLQRPSMHLSPAFVWPTDVPAQPEFSPLSSCRQPGRQASHHP